jgi:long-chain acyl-CoA synthetase
MLVQDILQRSAERLPDKVALVCEGRRLTYAELDQMADRLASMFITAGVRRGDRVAIYLHNSVEAVVGIFAILKAGGVFVPISRTTKPEKLSFILKNCRAKLLLTDERVGTDGLGSRLFAEVKFLSNIVVCGNLPENCAPAERYDNFAEIQTSYPAKRSLCRNIDLDLACLIYTSGTTGEPKGVMCDHASMLFVSGSVMEYLENREKDIVLNVLPLSFSYGLYQVFMAFKTGGTLVLEKSFTYPASILQRIEQERVTGFPGVPTLFAVLAQMDVSPFNLSSLRYLTNAAAALPPSHLKQLREKLPGVAFYSMYGLTETKRALYLPPELLDQKPGSVGIAIPGTEVWLEGESGNRLGPDSVGELVVRGRHVMRGYWEQPEQTARRFRVDRLPGERVCYTGDLFRMDEDGCMYFVSRKDDIIKVRGEKVAPTEIEHVLCRLDGVLEATVVGVPDSILGQAIKAFIVPKDKGLKVTDILAHCHAHLEDFMIPKWVELREALPKSPSGKILKQQLL